MGECASYGRLLFCKDANGGRFLLFTRQPRGGLVGEGKTVGRRGSGRARVKAGRVQGADQLAKRGVGGSCWQQIAQRGIFSRQVSFLLSLLQHPLNLRFLRGSNWDVDIGAGLIAGSHQMIQDYYPYMSAGPPSALEHVWRRDLIFSPEMRDDEGRRVVVLRLGQWPPQEVPLFDFFTGVFTLFELVVQEERTQVAGVVMVLDCKGFGLTHIRNFNMDMVMCINSFLCGAFPLWFRRIHIVNNPMLFSVFGKLVGPLLSSRVRENIVYHSSELNSLHSELHPSLLPTYLGGSQEDKGVSAAWVLAARQRDSDYKEKIRQAGQMLRGSGGNREATVSDCAGQRQPEEVSA